MIPVYVVEEYKEAIEDWIPVHADIIYGDCETYISNRMCTTLAKQDALRERLRVRAYVEHDPVFVRK